MIKNILLLFVGFIVGIPVGGGVIYTLYQQKNILPAPIDDLGILENSNAEEVRQTTQNIKPIEVYVPKTLASEGYQRKFEAIANSINQVAKNNNEKIFPGMEQLKQMSRAGNWNGIFDVMNEIKKSVEETKILLTTTKSSISSFQIEIANSSNANAEFIARSRDFAGAAENLVSSYEAYLETLGGFLTGKTPTQEMANDLNLKIADVNAKSKAVQSASTAVYTIIDAENGKVQESMSR